jgi:hypothetical protein
LPMLIVMMAQVMRTRSSRSAALRPLADPTPAVPPAVNSDCIGLQSRRASTSTRSRLNIFPRMDSRRRNQPTPRRQRLHRHRARRPRARRLCHPGSHPPRLPVPAAARRRPGPARRHAGADDARRRGVGPRLRCGQGAVRTGDGGYAEDSGQHILVVDLSESDPSCRRPFKFVASQDPLFDHLVGERVQLERAFETERLRGLDINFTPV